MLDVDDYDQRVRIAAVQTAAAILGPHACYMHTESYGTKRMEESQDMRQLTQAIETYIREGEWT